MGPSDSTRTDPDTITLREWVEIVISPKGSTPI